MWYKGCFLLFILFVCFDNLDGGLVGNALGKLHNKSPDKPEGKSLPLGIGKHVKPMISMIPEAKSVVKHMGSNAIRKPLDILNDVHKDIKEPNLDLKNLPEIVSTHSVFKKDNETLNCFGLPIKSFAKPLEKMITQTTRAEDVKFLFATRKHPDYTEVTVDDFDLAKTDFNVSRPTVLISHGFLNSGRLPWLKNLKDAFLKMDDVNVIVVDWHRGSNTWNYYAASLSTRIVGLQIAKLFATIRSKSESLKDVPEIENWGPIYFTGHSLGSHIVAHAAHLIKQSQEGMDKKWTVSRITGMDPAQPCFKDADLALKLDKDDAPFVDIIHSNTGLLLDLGFGVPDDIGHIDFYPNGGNVQPGCSDIDPSPFKILILPVDIMIETICSHGRAYEFMTEAVLNAATKNCTFVGYKWDRANKHVLGEKCEEGKCAEMGVNALTYHPVHAGSYFVPTRTATPYCEPEQDGKKVFEVHSSPNILSRIAG